MLNTLDSWIRVSKARQVAELGTGNGGPAAACSARHAVVPGECMLRCPLGQRLLLPSQQPLQVPMVVQQPNNAFKVLTPVKPKGMRRRRPSNGWRRGMLAHAMVVMMMVVVVMVMGRLLGGPMRIQLLLGHGRRSHSRSRRRSGIVEGTPKAGGLAQAPRLMLVVGEVVVGRRRWPCSSGGAFPGRGSGRHRVACAVRPGAVAVGGIGGGGGVGGDMAGSTRAAGNVHAWPCARGAAGAGRWRDGRRGAAGATP